MHSMTGYGRGAAEINNRFLTIEMKSVNNRFLEINCRMPKIFCAYEDGLRKLIGGRLKRGAVDVYFNYEDKSEKPCGLKIDAALAAGYAAEGKRLCRALRIKNNVDAAYILRQEGVISREAAETDGETLQRLLTEAAARALDNLCAMRGAEGNALYNELKSLGATLSGVVESIDGLAGKAAGDYREKIKARMAEVLKDVAVDENKILAEAAFLADRSDITEEIARLKSHLKQYGKLLDDEAEAGKKLDFLTQELNREANTIGSKVTDIKITGFVMDAKSVIEKIKEQVRNIE